MITKPLTRLAESRRVYIPVTPGFEGTSALDGVANAHHVHAWALTSGRYVFSGHLRVAEDADPQAVLKTAHGMLKEEYGFFFATLQVEAICLDESDATAIDVTRAAPSRTEP